MEKKCENCFQYDECNYENDECYGTGNQYLKWRPVVEYKLTEKYSEGFSLVDIAKVVNFVTCGEVKAKFFWLLMEFYADGCIDIEYIRPFNKQWMKFETIKNNLPWLVEKRFIEEDISQERWINLYEYDDWNVKYSTSASHRTKEKALLFKANDREYITTIKLPDKRR